VVSRIKDKTFTVGVDALPTMVTTGSRKRKPSLFEEHYNLQWSKEYSTPGDNWPAHGSLRPHGRTQFPVRVIPAHAALPSTEADEKLGLERRKAGLKPVHMPKTPFRPKQQSTYVEPDFIPDSTSSLDVLFQEFGNVAYKERASLSPRDDLIMYTPHLHEAILNVDLQWRDCPEAYHAGVEAIIQDFWDVFDPEGMPRPVRGFEFNIDTGPCKPIAVKDQRYGAHEAYHITRHALILYKKHVVEQDWGPWAFRCVLAPKPGQDHLTWFDYVFRLCINYRMLNAITRPFRFPVCRCDEAVESIYGRFRIQMDMDSGYWQIALSKMSKEKTAFLIPDGKMHWNAMPMGVMNALPFFVCIMMIMQEQWNDKRDERAIEECDSKVIVEDVILYGRKAAKLSIVWHISAVL